SGRLRAPRLVRRPAAVTRLDTPTTRCGSAPGGSATAFETDLRGRGRGGPPLAWTRDPFDRLIAGDALAAADRLVTKDEVIRASVELAVWLSLAAGRALLHPGDHGGRRLGQRAGVERRLRVAFDHELGERVVRAGLT